MLDKSKSIKVFLMQIFGEFDEIDIGKVDSVGYQMEVAVATKEMVFVIMKAQ